MDWWKKTRQVTYDSTQLKKMKKILIAFLYHWAGRSDLCDSRMHQRPLLTYNVLPYYYVRYMIFSKIQYLTGICSPTELWSTFKIYWKRLANHKVLVLKVRFSKEETGGKKIKRKVNLSNLKEKEKSAHTKIQEDVFLKKNSM